MDTSPIGNFALATMESIGEQFEDDDVRLRTVMIVAEVDTGAATHLLVSCDDDRPWVQIEFLNQAIDSLERQLEAIWDEQADE